MIDWEAMKYIVQLAAGAYVAKHLFAYLAARTTAKQVGRGLR